MLVKTSVKQNTQNALLPNTREEIVLRLIPFHSALSIFGHVGCEYYDIFRTHTLVSQFQESWLCVYIVWMYGCTHIWVYSKFGALDGYFNSYNPMYVYNCAHTTPYHICALCLCNGHTRARDTVCHSHVYFVNEVTANPYIHTFVHLCAHLHKLYRLTQTHAHTHTVRVRDKHFTSTYTDNAK